MLSRLNPPQVLVGSFLALILIGTLLLSSPWSAAGGSPGLLTALFTSTSAVCVTGLVVQDTATYWTAFGQVVIMLLIQIGGLGIMSFATFYALLFGKKIPFRQRLIMQQSINRSNTGGIVKIFRHLLFFTFTVELLAALLLALHWRPVYGIKTALWMGLFHAISAFNNAGFDLFGNLSSLTGLATDYTVNLIIIALIIAGGLGFVVVDELYAFRSRRRLSLHTKIVLITTALLILVPAILIFIAEYQHGLKDLPLSGKLLAAFFQAVTPRTAGFNTLNLNSLLMSTQFLIIILMFIGGSPGSTAGGIKTSTFWIVCAAIVSQIRGKKDVEVFHRRIAYQDVLRAMTIIALSGFFVMAMVLLLSFTVNAEFKQVMFEVVSAFSTVGLSLGLTAEMGTAGRLLIILTMLVGRLGPLTVALAFAYREKQPLVRYPEEKVMLG